MTNLRKFGPKAKDFDGKTVPPCAACNQPFKAGDYSTLVAIGPGDDPEVQAACLKGRPYNAVAVEAHWACVTGEVIT
jgi:hypothetical protein